MFVISHDKSTVGFGVDAEVTDLVTVPLETIAALPTLTYIDGMWRPTGATLGTLAAVMILDVLHDLPLSSRLEIAGAVSLGGHRSDWTIRTATWFTHSHPGKYASLTVEA